MVYDSFGQSDAEQLARLLGPALLAISLTEAINLDIWTHNTAAVIHLNGSILFVIGLTMVQHHNNWDDMLHVIISLTAWTSMILGLYRMALPEVVLRQTKATSRSTMLTITSVTGLIGLWLSLQGYHSFRG